MASAHRKPGGHAWYNYRTGASASLPRSRHALMLLEPNPVELSTSLVDQLDHHVPFPLAVASIEHEVVVEHSKVEYEGTASFLRLAGTGEHHNSRIWRGYGARGDGIDGAHQQAVECTTVNVVGHPFQVRLQLLGPCLRTAMATAYAPAGAPLGKPPPSPMYLSMQIRIFLRPAMLRTFGLRE